MKIKYLHNTRATRAYINIGVNCQIRLRLPVVEFLDIKKGDYVLFATDEDEGEKPKHLYLIKAKGVDHRGYKVSNGNGAHHISGKSLVDALNLEKRAYPFDQYDKDGVKAIRIIL